LEKFAVLFGIRSSILLDICAEFSVDYSNFTLKLCPEDRCGTFLRNIATYLSNYRAASYPEFRDPSLCCHSKNPYPISNFYASI